MNFGDMNFAALGCGIAGSICGFAMFFSPRFLKLVLEWTTPGHGF